MSYLHMGHFVIIEVARGCEAFSANAALVGLLSAVDASVSVEAARGRESLLADIANVRPLASVNPNVSFQKARTVEGLAAIVARKHVLLSSSSGSSVLDRGRAPDCR